MCLHTAISSLPEPTCAHSTQPPYDHCISCSKPLILSSRYFYTDVLIHQHKAPHITPYHTQRYEKDHNYNAASEQLKTIRQDLTAGRVHNKAFTQHVYETHARLALAAGDMAELRSCLGVLARGVYAYGDGGEFAAYGVLFALLAQVEGRHKDVLAMELYQVAHRGVLRDAWVKRALGLCRAVLGGCSVVFWRLASAWEDNALVVALGKHVAAQTCRVMVSATFPTVPLAHMRQMCFGCAEGGEQEELMASLVLLKDASQNSLVDIRATRAKARETV